MYSVSLRSVEQAQHDLDRILGSPQVVWYAPQGAPATWSRTFAMRLRNAMHAAEFNAPRYAHVARYKDLFRTTTIRVLNERTVAAIANGREAVEVPAATAVAPTTDGHTPLPAGSAAPSALDRVLMQYHSKRGNAAHIRIAQPGLDAAELGKLAAVLAQDNWMVMQSFDGALTLAPDDPFVPAEAKITPAEADS